MNRQLSMPEALKRELAKLTECLTSTEKIMLRNRMAKIVIIDGNPYFIDMVMIDKGESDGRSKV